ncbi:MAG: LTA synthase family protein [Firmicutes bacterium]|nr:LTA synthase family protein [Bacillota bacterium]
MKKKIKETSKTVSKKIKTYSKSYMKTNILFLSFVVTSVLNAMLLRFLTVKNYFDVFPIIADLAVVVIIGAFGYFLKPKNQFKYFSICSIFFAALCVINSMYYTNYLSFASLSLLQTSLQIVDVADAVVENVMELKDFSYIWAPLALFFLNHALKKREYYKRVAEVEVGKVRALNTMVFGLIVVGVFISTLNSVDISRLGKQWNREFIVMRFGIYTYQINDVIASLKPQISPLFGYDEKAKEFREYYDKRDSEEKKENEYTDVFKGKNLLVIHAESIQQFVMNLKFNDEELTPNLNRIAKEGLYFSNFYAQESVGTSSDTEFTLNTSLMPATSGTVFISYWDRDYVTIPKILKEQGYYAFSMHGNKGSMWNRDTVHIKTFGYDKFYNYKKDFKIDETIGLGLSDKSFFKQAVPKIKKISETKKNFYGTLIMLSNHTPFSDIDKLPDPFAVDFKYEKENPETGEKETVTAPYMEGTKLGNYFKFVHYADSAIGQLFEDLDKAGILDNTVIAIYGDHDAKLKKSEFEYFYNYDPYTDSVLDSDDPNYHEVDFYDYELNRKVPFIIWSKDHENNSKYSKEISKVMGMYDVLPTLGNMFGFTDKYALGHDIFSIDENVVIFPDGNWLTDKMYYNHQKGEGKVLNEGDTVSIEYIKKYNEMSEEVLNVSDSIIVYDLIKKQDEAKKMVDNYNKNK